MYGSILSIIRVTILPVGYLPYNILPWNYTTITSVLIYYGYYSVFDPGNPLLTIAEIYNAYLQNSDKDSNLEVDSVRIYF